MAAARPANCWSGQPPAPGSCASAAPTSTATAPFSAFAGVHALVRRAAGRRRRAAVRRRAPHRCARAMRPCVSMAPQAPGCRLLDGATQDLNLMASGGDAADASGPRTAAWTTPHGDARPVHHGRRRLARRLHSSARCRPTPCCGTTRRLPGPGTSNPTPAPARRMVAGLHRRQNRHHGRYPRSGTTPASRRWPTTPTGAWSTTAPCWCRATSWPGSAPLRRPAGRPAPHGRRGA